jgi:hypothetical protein
LALGGLCDTTIRTPGASLDAENPHYSYCGTIAMAHGEKVGGAAATLSGTDFLHRPIDEAAFGLPHLTAEEARTLFFG